MNRNQIEYILALAELKNFGKAAESCYITQSTLSAMVAKFEEQIGIVIFDRKKRPVAITPDGQEVIAALRSVNREFQLLDDKISDLKGLQAKHLSIACIPTVATYLYPLILDELARRHKQVEFTIHELTTDQIIEALIDGRVDVGIASTPLRHADLDEEYLYREEFLLYDYGDKKQARQYSISDIDLDRLWLMEEGHCLRNQIGKICQLRQNKKIKGNIVYNCGTMQTLTEMVRINRGLTLLPKMVTLTDDRIEHERLHQLLAPVPHREIGALTHRYFTKNKVYLDLIKLIKSTVSQLMPQVDRENYQIVEPV